MVRDETRDLAHKEWDGGRARMLKYDSLARWRSEARTRAAGSADAAHGCGVRWVAGIAGIAAWSLMMVADVVLVRLFVRDARTAVLPLAQGHQHTRVAA